MSGVHVCLLTSHPSAERYLDRRCFGPSPILRSKYGLPRLGIGDCFSPLWFVAFHNPAEAGFQNANAPVTGIWDPHHPTEGAHTAFLTFADGAAASLTYNGYGHFDTDALNGWVGEMGQARGPDGYGATRKMLETLHTAVEKAELKDARAYGVSLTASTPREAKAPTAYNHFGFVLAACERGTLPPMQNGLEIYGDHTKRFLSMLAPEVTPA